MIVCPLHWYFRPAHVAEVAVDMERMGPPILRGHLDDVSGAFLLREGTHRIRAALALGVVPVLVAVPWWRSRQALVNARIAAATRGLTFKRVALRLPL